MINLRLAASIAVVFAAPAVAQQTNTAPASMPSGQQVTPGALVYGPQNVVLGNITKIVDGIATVNIGTHDAPLPVSAFGSGPSGPTLGVTREQLGMLIDQLRSRQIAQRDAALVAGTSVVTADGQPLGTVEALYGDNIVVLRPGTQGRIALPRAVFTFGGDQLRTRATLADLNRSGAPIASVQ